MAGDHRVDFSEPVSSFRTVFFVWSAYTGGVIHDYNFNVTSLPTAFVAERPGVSTVHPVREPAADTPRDCAKLLYVSDSYASGNDINKEGQNASFVLREVIGVG